MIRKYIDCREHPSISNCSLRISGTEDEVLRAAMAHAMTVHGETDTPKFREDLRKSLKDERESQSFEKSKVA